MHVTASELFREPMATWGLRGDPYLWDALSRRLGAEPLPATAESLVALLDREFRVLTGQGIAAERDVFVEEFAHGGMSSGHVCVSYWRETAIPLLVERLHSLQAGKPATRQCGQCGQSLPGDCFRKGSPHCVWCVFEPKEKRARARYSDKLKAASGRLSISREDFVRWLHGDRGLLCLLRVVLPRTPGAQGETPAWLLCFLGYRSSRLGWRLRGRQSGAVLFRLQHGQGGHAVSR